MITIPHSKIKHNDTDGKSACLIITSLIIIALKALSLWDRRKHKNQRCMGS